MRHLRKFRLSPEVLLSLGSGRFEVIARPLPEDARVFGAYWDEERHTFVVIVESSHFTPIHQGDAIPDIDPPAIRKLAE